MKKRLIAIVISTVGVVMIALGIIMTSTTLGTYPLWSMFLLTIGGVLVFLVGMVLLYVAA